MTTRPADEQSAAAPRSAHILVGTSCWSCGAETAKEVRRQGRGQRFAWSCATCDVEWTGPGRELPRSA